MDIQLSGSELNGIELTQVLRLERIPFLSMRVT